MRVIVIGAGPGGAVLALLLARRGIDVTLLERHRDFAREFRGEVLLPGWLEVLDKIGLAERLRRVPQVRIAAIEVYVGARRRLRLPIAPDAFGPYPPVWMSQPALLEALVAESARHSNFRLERGVTARELLSRDGRFVGVGAVGPDGEVDFEGDLVVGADGRNSVVRKRAGLEARADPIPMDIVWLRLPMAPFFATDPHARAYLGGGHLLLVVPIYDGLMQIGWIIPKGGFGDVRSRGMAAALEEMARHVSPDLAVQLRDAEDEAVEPFLLSTVSDRVREWWRPGLLVIGDAAHVMSPVGGQGLNIAIRDAAVAANHLVPVLAGEGSAAAIDAELARIEAERLPEVAEIQRLQALPPPILLRDTWWTRALLEIIPLILGSGLLRPRTTPLLRRFAWGVTEVKVRV